MKMRQLIERTENKISTSSSLSKMEQGIVNAIGGYSAISKWGFDHISNGKSEYPDEFDDENFDSALFIAGIILQGTAGKSAAILLQKDGKYEVNVDTKSSGRKGMDDLDILGVKRMISKYFG
jgi:hypothetical protein